jgi:hypothetical protein
MKSGFGSHSILTLLTADRERLANNKQEWTGKLIAEWAIGKHFDYSWATCKTS